MDTIASFSYTADGSAANPALAKNTTAKIVNSNDVRNIAGLQKGPLSIRMWLAGGGAGGGANSTSGITVPAMIRLRFYDKGGNAVMSDYWPMPGSIHDGTSSAPTALSEMHLAQAYYQFPIPNLFGDVDEGSGWELEIRNSAGTNQASCEIANANPIYVRGEVVTGHLDESGHGGIQAVTSGTYIPNGSYGGTIAWKRNLNTEAGTVSPGPMIRLGNEGSTALIAYNQALYQHDWFGGDGDATNNGFRSNSGSIAAAGAYADNPEQSAFMTFMSLRSTGATFNAESIELEIWFGY